MTKIALLLSACLLAGCAFHDPIVAQDLNPGRLPPPDRSLSIAGLGPCTDNPDRSLHLKAGEPVTVLVHSCFGSSGQFRALAQVLAFQGQQSACFTTTTAPRWTTAPASSAAQPLCLPDRQVARPLPSSVTVRAH
jgi:hypothetical protein